MANEDVQITLMDRSKVHWELIEIDGVAYTGTEFFNGITINAPIGKTLKIVIYCQDISNSEQIEVKYSATYVYIFGSKGFYFKESI
jgi:hypothetical protein